MQYPHWLMAAGAILVVLGFVGLAFRQRRDTEPDDGLREMQANEGDSITAWRPPPQAR
jgi:hypothetical protein